MPGHRVIVKRSRVSEAREPKRYYNAKENKAVCFFSASSTSDFQQLWDFGIHESLVSYFYIRKNLSYWDENLPKFKAEGGIFMTDSGAFSFMAKFRDGSPEMEEATKEEFWLPYLHDYIEWIRAHKDYIFCAANLDLDKIVGFSVVDKWNKEYFEPLEKETGVQIVYVAHEESNEDGAKGFMSRFEYYCKKYPYVGANQMWKSRAPQIYQMVKRYNVRVHGFAWTDLPLLRRYPFFSVDSVTWLGGVRFGITYDYDGKNFRSLDMTKKTVRRTRQLKYEKAGIDVEGIKKEKRIPINQMNLLGWLGFRKEYMKSANLRLHNKVVSTYVR